VGLERSLRLGSMVARSATADLKAPHISSAIVSYTVSEPPLSSLSKFSFTDSAMVVPGVNSKCTSPVPVNTDAGEVLTVPLPGFDWVRGAKWILLRTLAVLCCGFSGET
jgi:hypothetical protein